MPLTWNPHTGNFQVPFDPNTIAQFGFSAACDAAVSIGDPVVVSLTVDETVERLTNNNYGKRRVVGIVATKPTTTTAFVANIGTVTVSGAGLTRGLPVWVSTAGWLTQTAPTTGDVQMLGTAFSSEKILLNIEPRKLQRL